VRQQGYRFSLETLSGRTPNQPKSNDSPSLRSWLPNASFDSADSAQAESPVWCPSER